MEKPKKKIWKWGDHERLKQEIEEEPDKEKERPGLCYYCKNGNFRLKLINRDIHRTCKRCGSQINAETGAIVKEGEL